MSTIVSINVSKRIQIPSYASYARALQGHPVVSRVVPILRDIYTLV